MVRVGDAVIVMFFVPFRHYLEKNGYVRINDCTLLTRA